METIYVVTFWRGKARISEFPVRATDKTISPSPEHRDAWNDVFGTYKRLTSPGGSPSVHNGRRVYGFNRKEVLDVARKYKESQAQKHKESLKFAESELKQLNDLS